MYGSRDDMFQTGTGTAMPREAARPALHTTCVIRPCLGCFFLALSTQHTLRSHKVCQHTLVTYAPSNLASMGESSWVNQQMWNGWDEEMSTAAAAAAVVSMKAMKWPVVNGSEGQGDGVGSELAWRRAETSTSVSSLLWLYYLADNTGTLICSKCLQLLMRENRGLPHKTALLWANMLTVLGFAHVLRMPNILLSPSLSVQLLHEGPLHLVDFSKLVSIETLIKDNPIKEGVNPSVR